MSHTRGIPRSVFERLLEAIEANPNSDAIIVVRVPADPIPGLERLSGELLRIVTESRHILRSPMETACGITPQMLPDGVDLHIACRCGARDCLMPVNCPMCLGGSH